MAINPQLPWRGISRFWVIAGRYFKFVATSSTTLPMAWPASAGFDRSSGPSTGMPVSTSGLVLSGVAI